MKTHVKKKAVRAAWKALAKDGKINTASGQWTNRGGVKDDSMKRDFFPNR